MAKPTRLSLAKNSIFSLFSAASPKVYSGKDLASLLLEKRQGWNLAHKTTASEFISFLKQNGELQSIEFRSTNYDRLLTRYSWGNASPLEFALSIKTQSHLSHATAAGIHGLTAPDPSMIYLNAEQSPKPTRPISLSQDRIDFAFSRKQRQSNLIYESGNISVTIIAGKNTKHLGVETIAGPTSEMLRITNLERTLIDMAVRPAYSGGISKVLKAYQAAKDRLMADRLLDILKKLDYAYPYHQAIGFLMQTAGYSKSSLADLKALGLHHKFYLTHDLRQPQYSKDWNLFYPKNLETQ